MSKMEKLSVDVLKPIFVWAFKTGSKFEGIAGNVLKKLPVILIALLGGLKFLNNLHVAWEQFKDMDEAEANEIYTAVAESFSITNKEVEAKIEEYFMYALNAWILISGTFLLFKSTK